MPDVPAVFEHSNVLSIVFQVGLPGFLERCMARSKTSKNRSPDDLIPTVEAAAELGVSRSRVHILIQEGRLRAMRIAARG